MNISNQLVGCRLFLIEKISFHSHSANVLSARVVECIRFDVNFLVEGKLRPLPLETH